MFLFAVLKANRLFHLLGLPKKEFFVLTVRPQPNLINSGITLVIELYCKHLSEQDKKFYPV